MRATVNSGPDNMTDYLKIDNQRIAYTTTGSPSNPAIVFVHGLMSHRGVWTSTVGVLKENYFCITPDLLGFGDSDKPDDGDYSIPAQAERVLKMANYFRLRQFNLVGHSMGGQISTYLTATLAPHRVYKLVNVDGVVTGKLSDRAQNIIRRMVAMAEKIPALYKLSSALCDVWRPFAIWTFKDWFYQAKALAFDSWALDRHMAMNPEIARSTPRAWDSLNAMDLTPSIKNITSPALVIFGIQDGTVPVAQAHIFKNELPAAQLVLIDQCGHFPMYEKFDEYIRPVQEFLNHPTG